MTYSEAVSVEGMSMYLTIPQNLSAVGHAAAEVISHFIHEKGFTSSVKIFYSPEEWANRGETYGLNSELIVIHDGDAARAFNWDYEDCQLIEELRVHLASVGVYVEDCTGWYSAIYRIN